MGIATLMLLVSSTSASSVNGTHLRTPSRRLLFAGETDPCYSPAKRGDDTTCINPGYICPTGKAEVDDGECTTGRPSPICLFIMTHEGDKFGCSWWNGACWGACGW